MRALVLAACGLLSTATTELRAQNGVAPFALPGQYLVLPDRVGNALNIETLIQDGELTLAYRGANNALQIVKWPGGPAGMPDVVLPADAVAQLRMDYHVMLAPAADDLWLADDGNRRILDQYGLRYEPDDTFVYWGAPAPLTGYFIEQTIANDGKTPWNPTFALPDGQTFTPDLFLVPGTSENRLLTGTDDAGNGVLLEFDAATRSLRGLLYSGGDVYRVVPAGPEATVLLRETDQVYPVEHPENFDRTIEGAVPVPSPPLPGDAPVPNPGGPPPDVVIDLLFAYTAEAEQQGLAEYAFYNPDYAAGATIEHVIEWIVEWSNGILFASGVQNVELRVVHSYRVDEGDGTALISRFAGQQDGMDEVHGLLETHGADVAILLFWADNDWNCGEVLPQAIPAQRENAFAVVNIRCAAGPLFTLLHEISHLLGARHNLEAIAPEDRDNTAFPYAHGFLSPALWRDIMAIRQEHCVCGRLPYVSNPARSWGDFKIGVEGESDVARLWRLEAPRIAAFR